MTKPEEKTYYSIIQYVPDRFRMEAINVGLVLLRENPHLIWVKILEDFERIKKVFVISPINLEMSLNSLKNILSHNELKTFEDLKSFASSLANDLRMIEPRLVFTNNFLELYLRLVV